MIASQVRVSDETWTLNKLNAKKRMNLRKQLIKDYIRSKPVGTRITTGELGAVSRKGKNVNALLNKMFESGEISRIPLEKPAHYAYEVNEDTKTIKKAKIIFKEVKAGSTSPLSIPKDTVEPIFEPENYIEPEKETKEAVVVAKQWAWDNYSDSLREFINWYNEQ